MRTRGVFIRINCCFLMVWSALTVAGQEKLQVRGQFQEDSMRVGDDIFYSLTARYPKDMQVVFPDSSFNYAPFEFGRKRIFITSTENGISFDSAVYHLTTFETDSLLRLRLPVYQVNALDCTKYLANWDTVRMQLLVKAAPEFIGPDLPVRASIAYQEVPKPFNTPLLLIGITLTVLLAGVLWVVFGARVRQYITTKRLRRAHQSFLNAYTAQVDQIKKAFSAEKTEAALAMWKKYMEGLNRRPYTRLTTHETLLEERDEYMVNNLQKLDAAIYGTNSDVVDPLLNLRTIAEKRFDEKIREVRNG